MANWPTYGFIHNGPGGNISLGAGGNIGLSAGAKKRWCLNAHTMRLQDLRTGVLFAVEHIDRRDDFYEWVVRYRLDNGTRSEARLLDEEVEYYGPRPQVRPHNPVAQPVQTGTTEGDDTVALRNEFTFDYTGEEIATAIDGKIAEINAKIDKANEFDLDTLVEANLITKDKRAGILSSIENHEREIERWEAEKRPYAKEGKKAFSLDAEDVRYFGL